MDINILLSTKPVHLIQGQNELSTKPVHQFHCPPKCLVTPKLGCVKYDSLQK